jgi:hypothetical protein
MIYLTGGTEKIHATCVCNINSGSKIPFNQVSIWSIYVFHVQFCNSASPTGGDIVPLQHMPMRTHTH